MIEEEEVVATIRRIIRATDLHSRRLSKTVGLTTPQLVLLQTISKLGAVSISQLAGEVSLSQATVPNILNRLHSLDLGDDWQSWRLSGSSEILRPALAWEGADLPLAPSRPGAAESPVRQLRDPCIFEEGGRVYLLYSGAGEGGIGLAEIKGL